MNWILLGATIMFLAGMVVNYYRIIITENTMERDFMMSMVSGSHWFQIVLPTIVYAVMPNVLWLKKMRQTIYSTGLIVFSWFLVFYVIDYLTYKDEDVMFKQSRHREFPIVITVDKALLFFAIMAIVYLLVWKRNKKTTTVL